MSLSFRTKSGSRELELANPVRLQSMHPLDPLHRAGVVQTTVHSSRPSSALLSKIRTRKKCFCELFRSASNRLRSAALTSTVVRSRVPFPFAKRAYGSLLSTTG
jgi:hypothetical protein